MTTQARQTSIDTYHKIEAEGLLSKRRWQVYDVLFRFGPLTATQIADLLPFHKSSSVGANVHARLGELRTRLVVKELNEVVCPVTNQTVILWDVTALLPIDPKIEKRIKCEHCNGKGWRPIGVQE